MTHYEVWVVNPVNGHKNYIKTYDQLYYARQYVLYKSEYNSDMLRIYKVSDTPNYHVVDSEGIEHETMDCDFETRNCWYFRDQGKIDYMKKQMTEALNEMDPKFKGMYKDEVTQDKDRRKTVIVCSLTFEIPFKRVRKSGVEEPEGEEYGSDE